MVTGDGAMAARVAQVRAELEGLVGERIVAFGSFAAPGYIDSGTRRRAVPGRTIWYHIGARFRRGGGRTPLQLFLVLSPTRIVAVSMEASWRSARSGFPIEVVLSWDRSSTIVEITSGPDGIGVTLADERGETRFDSADFGRGFNDELISALGG